MSDGKVTFNDRQILKNGENAGHIHEVEGGYAAGYRIDRSYPDPSLYARHCFGPAFPTEEEAKSWMVENGHLIDQFTRTAEPVTLHEVMAAIEDIQAEEQGK